MYRRDQLANRDVGLTESGFGVCVAVGKVRKGDGLELTASWGTVFRPLDIVARIYGAMRLAELGQAAGSVAYPAVSAAIKRFEKRLNS
jgi:hypothetical protein